MSKAIVDRVKTNRSPAAEPSANGKQRLLKLAIPKLCVETLSVEIKGTAPLVIRAWNQKTMQQLSDKQEGRTPASRQPEDPEKTYQSAKYISIDGWEGIPAGAFKAALVDAVSCCDIPIRDFNMTLAKKCIPGVIPDGVCRISGRELIRIHGKSEIFSIMQPTSGGGPYMSHRPMYREWRCHLVIRYNSLKIDAQGVLNLLAVAGAFVGVGEHRPSAKESKTGSFGLWEIVPQGKTK